MQCDQNDLRDYLKVCFKVKGNGVKPVSVNIAITENLPKEVCSYKGRAVEITDSGIEIKAFDEQLSFAGGYDHNYVINGSGFRKFTELYSETSGITMTCYTDMPAVQFYSGNLLTDRNGRKGKKIKWRYGLCLETQFFPNSVNEKKFPLFVLKAGETFKSKTEYKFS